MTSARALTMVAVVAVLAGVVIGAPVAFGRDGASRAISARDVHGRRDVVPYPRVRSRLRPRAGQSHREDVGARTTFPMVLDRPARYATR